jgi:hypothetical protein
MKAQDMAELTPLEFGFTSGFQKAPFTSLTNWRPIRDEARAIVHKWGQNGIVLMVPSQSSFLPTTWWLYGKPQTASLPRSMGSEARLDQSN